VAQICVKFWKKQSQREKAAQSLSAVTGLSIHASLKVKRRKNREALEEFPLAIPDIQEGNEVRKETLATTEAHDDTAAPDATKALVETAAPDGTKALVETEALVKIKAQDATTTQLKLAGGVAKFKFKFSFKFNLSLNLLLIPTKSFIILSLYCWI